MRPLGFDNPLCPEPFLPHAQASNGAMAWVVRTEGDPAASIPAIQNAVWAAAPNLAFFSVSTVDRAPVEDARDAAVHDDAARALRGGGPDLAGLGIYGVIAVATAQRTREIGLRIAPGARLRDVVWMVVRDAVRLDAAGVAVGLLASLLFSQTLTNLLYDVTPFDSTTLAAVSWQDRQHSPHD